MLVKYITKTAKGSRPLLGVLLSQFYVEVPKTEIQEVFSSPPRGSLISIRLDQSDEKFLRQVLVPSSGFLYFNFKKQTNEYGHYSSRPLHGVLIFQLGCLFYCTEGRICSRPLHGVLIFQ